MGCGRQGAHAAIVAALVAGCAHITPRDNPPDDTFVTTTSLNQATACVVRQLDQAVSGMPHGAITIVPNSVYEVKPQKEATLTAELYFVRVAAGQGGTEIQTFAISTWKGRIVPAVRRCT